MASLSRLLLVAVAACGCCIDANGVRKLRSNGFSTIAVVADEEDDDGGEVVVVLVPCCAVGSLL